MPLTTVTVSIAIAQITGDALPYARVRFELTGVETVDDVVVTPQFASMVCGADGTGSIDLVPNVAQQYFVTITNQAGDLEYSGYATVPDASCDLHDIIDPDPAPHLGLTRLLATTAGAGMVGFDANEGYDAGSVGAALALKADADDAVLTGTTTAEDVTASGALTGGTVVGGGVRSTNFSSGSKQFNFASAASSYGTQWIYSRLYGFGTLAASASHSSFNTIVATDQADAQAVSYLSGMAMVYRAAAGAIGSRVAFHSDMGVVGAVTAGSATGDFVSHLASAFAAANAGGDGTFTTDPDTGYVGALFGGNDHPRLASGATYWRFFAGREINAEIESGASAFARVGLFVATGTNAASQALEDDCAFAVANKSGATVPWKHGIKFGLSWGVWPFNSSSTLIGAKKRAYPTGNPETTINAAYGVDFSEVTFATGAFKSTGFLVDPDGDTTVKSITLTASSTPASASASGTAGQVSWDSSYIYVATAANTWKRAALSTW